VDFKTCGECAHAGADTFISGTALFRRPNLAAAVRKMRKLIQAARHSPAGLSCSSPLPELV